MQYFNESNSEVEYIKDILRSTYIPTIRVFNNKTNLKPIPSTGNDLQPSNPNIEVKNTFEGETIIFNGNLELIIDSSNTMRHLAKYEFGKFYPNISTNFISSRNYYDSNLHEALGRYLRFYSNYYNIDVMNFYNCFSNRYFTNFELPVPTYNSNINKEDGNKVTLKLKSYTGNYKVTAFPIIWDAEYKIKFYGNLKGNITAQLVYFNGNVPLGAVDYNINTLEPNTYPLIINDNLTFKASLEDVVNNLTNESRSLKWSVRQGLISRQSQIYLFLQYPVEIDSFVVVLEQPKFTSAINNELLNISTYNNIDNQVAFSDTLLEYISGNAITPANKIKENIYKIQLKVFSESFKNKYGFGGTNYEDLGIEVPKNYKPIPGYFDSYLHKIIYNSFSQPIVYYVTEENVVVDRERVDLEKMTIVDTNIKVKLISEPNATNFIGFVDKNIESKLNSLNI